MLDLVLELIEILRGPAASRYSFGVNELSERLGQPQHMLDDCVHVEQQRLAANQVSIGNVITSMRLLSALDWTLFFERVSLVEQRLRQDPAGVYARMDFASRDMYRHEIESLAKRGGHEELHVAAKALKFAVEAQTKGSADPRTKHIGYYLIDGGRRELERQLNYRPKLRERIVRGVKRWPSLFYLTGIGGLTVLGVWFLVWGLMQYGVSLAVAALLGVVAAIPISELAVTLLQRAGDDAAAPPSASEARIHREHSRPLPHVGRDAHDADQRRGRSRTRRKIRNSLPGQSRAWLEFRAVERLCRRSGRTHVGG